MFSRVILYIKWEIYLTLSDSQQTEALVLRVETKEETQNSS